MSFEQEINALTEAFYNFDTDKDGYLTVDELKSIMMDQGMMLSNAEADEFVACGQPDADGFVDYRALARFLVESCRE
ncbi:Calmodulin [Entamoeba marina]